MLYYILICLLGSIILRKTLCNVYRGPDRLPLKRLNSCRPPPSYPHKDPILGLDWFFGSMKATKESRLLEDLDQHFRTIGNTFRHITLGHRGSIMTNEPENIRAILLTNFRDWHIAGSRLHATRQIVGYHSIITNNGSEWHSARALMRPAFSRNQLINTTMFEKHIGNLISHVPGNGVAVDLQPLFYKLTMDLTTDFLYGLSTSALRDTSQAYSEFVESFDACSKHIAILGRLGWLARLLPSNQLSKKLNTVQSFIRRYMTRAMDEIGLGTPKNPQHSLIKDLIMSGASTQYIHDQLITLILAGRDTTAGLLSFLFFSLARRPDIVKKLQDEIEGCRDFTWEGLKQMKYLEMVVKEALRLFPAIPTNSRVAVRDTILPVGGGPDGKYPVFIPKGTSIRWSVWSLHRREDIFGQDCHEFIPERWVNPRPTWQYLPFSGGPRSCIGQQLALLEIYYVTARLLQTFEVIEPRDERPTALKLDFTLSLANGCLVGTERRN